jgi:hypothetical protein
VKCYNVGGNGFAVPEVINTLDKRRKSFVVFYFLQYIYRRKPRIELTDVHIESLDKIKERLTVVPLDRPRKEPFTAFDTFKKI